MSDIMQLINQYLAFLDTPILRTVVFILKILFIIASAAMLGFAIWALIKTTYLKRLFLWDLQEFVTYHPYGAKKLYGPWQKIKKRLEAGLDSEYKLAVIEADLMTDDILKGSGFAGTTFLERLSNLTEATMPNIKEVSKAHEIRNEIIQNPDYKISLGEAKKIIEIYETGLTDLQAL